MTDLQFRESARIRELARINESAGNYKNQTPSERSRFVERVCEYQFRYSLGKEQKEKYNFDVYFEIILKAANSYDAEEHPGVPFMSWLGGLLKKRKPNIKYESTCGSNRINHEPTQTFMTYLHAGWRVGISMKALTTMF